MKRILRAFAIIACALLLANLFEAKPAPRNTDGMGLQTVHVIDIKPILPTQFASMMPVHYKTVSKPSQPKVAVSAAPTSHESLMRAAGIAEGDYQYVEFIVYHESTWNYRAVNYLGATGLCQSLPGNKMATAGSDYLTNPVTQLKWCNSYAVQRYGSWAEAYSQWLQFSWW